MLLMKPIQHKWYHTVTGSFPAWSGGFITAAL